MCWLMYKAIHICSSCGHCTCGLWLYECPMPLCRKRRLIVSISWGCYENEMRCVCKATFNILSALHTAPEHCGAKTVTAVFLRFSTLCCFPVYSSAVSVPGVLLCSVHQLAGWLEGLPLPPALNRVPVYSLSSRVRLLTQHLRLSRG